jgi:hypothetical protein
MSLLSEGLLGRLLGIMPRPVPGPLAEPIASEDRPITATMTVLPDSRSIPIEITQYAHGYFSFSMADNIAAGTVIRVDSGEMLWFAEATSCTSKAGHYRIAAHIEHSLNRGTVRVLMEASGFAETESESS